MTPHNPCGVAKVEWLLVVSVFSKNLLCKLLRNIANKNVYIAPSTIGDLAIIPEIEKGFELNKIGKH